MAAHAAAAPAAPIRSTSRRGIPFFVVMNASSSNDAGIVPSARGEERGPRRFSSEESGQTARMNEDDRLSSAKAAARRLAQQAGKGLARVDGVQEDPFGTEQPPIAAMPASEGRP